MKKVGFIWLIEGISDKPINCCSPNDSRLWIAHSFTGVSFLINSVLMHLTNTKEPFKLNKHKIYGWWSKILFTQYQGKLRIWKINDKIHWIWYEKDIHALCQAKTLQGLPNSLYNPSPRCNKEPHSTVTALLKWLFLSHSLWKIKENGCIFSLDAVQLSHTISCSTSYWLLANQKTVWLLTFTYWF